MEGNVTLIWPVPRKFRIMPRKWRIENGNGNGKNWLMRFEKMWLGDTRSQKSKIFEEIPGREAYYSMFPVLHKHRLVVAQLT